MRSTWYFLVALSICALVVQGSVRADAAASVPLATSLSTYLTAINTAKTKQTYADMYAACLPLCPQSVSGSTVDLGSPVRDNWYRLSLQDLTGVRDALTSLAVLLSSKYAVENSAFADLYADANFQRILLNANDPARTSGSDSSWTGFLSNQDNTNFYNAFNALRRRRDFYRAAIDPTLVARPADALTQLSSYTTSEISTSTSALNKALTKPALPVGAPISGDTVVLRVDVAGSRYFLKSVKTDDGFVLIANGTDPLDAAAQFKVAVDFNTLGLQLTTAEALYLNAENVIGSAGWLPTKKQKATRLIFAGTAFNSTSPVVGKFALDGVAGSGQNGSLPQFLLRSLNFTNTMVSANLQPGYLKVDLASDLFVRVLDSSSPLNADGTFVSYKTGDATPFAFIKITDLHRSLSVLRTVSEVQARIAGYSSLFDGSAIATLDDFLLVVAEAQNYVDGCRADANAWKIFSAANGINLAKALLQKMRQNMSATPVGGGVAAATSAYAQQNTAVSALEISVNSGMSALAAGARFSDGLSVKDSLVVITTANGNMLSVGDNGVLTVVSRDMVDPSAQFVAEVDSAGNVSFRSLSAGNKYFQAGAVTTSVQGWLAKARTDISRASFLRSQAGPAEKFMLIPQGATLGSYAFKNVESLGFLRVDSDNMVRSLDPSGTGVSMPANQTNQTVFTFVPIDGFVKKLSELRLETQDKIRLDGYVALSAEILTDTHVNLLLNELSVFIDRAVKSRTQWSVWQTAGLDKLLRDWIPQGLAAFSDRSMYSSIIALLEKGYQADTTTQDTTGLIAGDVIVLQIQGEVNSYLQVQPDGTCKVVSGAQYLLDPSCQLVIAKNASDLSLIRFQSTFLNNASLHAPDIAVPTNAVADLLMDRLAELSKVTFDVSSDPFIDFDVVVGSSSATVGEGTPFVLKRHGRDGFLKIGDDLFVRFFDSASTTNGRVCPPVAQAAASKLSYAVVSSLQKKFTNLRGITDDAARIAGYKAALSSVITLGDLKLLLFELKYYILQPRTDTVVYASFKAAQGALTDLLTQITTLFSNSLKQLDAKTVPTVDSLRQNLADQLVQTIPGAFSKLATPDRVAYLEAMFPSLTTSAQATEFLALFRLTMIDRSMFSDAILARVKTLFDALKLNDFTKVHAGTVDGSDQKELDAWDAQLNSVVKFVDVAKKLQSLAETMRVIQPASSIEDSAKNQLVAYATALLKLLDTSTDADRAAVVGVLESAAYTYLNDKKAALVPIANAVKAYVLPQNVPATYSAQLDALALELKALTVSSPSSAMEQFIADATIMVGRRVQALDADITRLGGILDDALWHPLVLNQSAAAGDKARYDLRITALVNLVKVAIPYLDLIQNLTDMLDKNAAFAATDITYFMARAQQLVKSQATQKDPSVIDAAIKILTRGSRYQVSDRRVDLEKNISQLGAYRGSLSGATGKTYIQKINDLKNQLSVLDSQASERALTDAESQSFFDALQLLVDSRLDGTPSQINNLIAWLSSSVVSTSRLVFSKLDGIAQVQKIVSVLQTPSSVADRFTNLQQFLKNNPQFADSQFKLAFIEKAGDLVTPDSRQQAISEKFDIKTSLSQLLVFAKANQFSGDTSVGTGAQNLDKIIAQLSAPLNQVLGTGTALTKMLADFALLESSAQASTLDRGISEIVDRQTAITYLKFMAIAVGNRINAKDVDLARLKKVIASALRCPGIIDDATKQLPNQLQDYSSILDQPLVFSDYYNAVNVIVSGFPADASQITSATKTLLVTQAQKMADNLVSSVDQSSRNLANSLLKKLAFNQLDDRSGELLKICDLIEAYVPSEQVGKIYTQSISVLMPQTDKLTSSNLSAFISTLSGLVARRAEGIGSDYDALKEVIDKVRWNPLVQNEVGQGNLKILNGLTDVLNKPTSAVDLIKLLTARLTKQTFTPDDILYFQNKAQEFVDGRTGITDKALLDQAISLLNTASRYQMSSKRAELDAMVATLEAQKNTFIQQVYVSFGDQISQMQTRLTDLNAAAEAQKLTDDDAALFMKDLESLVASRAQGIAANITAMSAWLQGVITQSRFFFVTKGAKDKATVLIATLAQPVSYGDQYNYLVNLLRDYPHFSSVQMLGDFLDKCTYLASDAAKQQAVSEGFDYKKMVDILIFASQNQAQSSKGQVDGLIAQLNAPLPAGQVVAKTFNDILSEQELALPNLKDSDSPTALASFVTVLEGLVSSRLDGNDAELARFSQLLQKAQWNKVIRQSSQSAALLVRIQNCIDNLAKPVFFADEAAHLIAMSQLKLVSSDEQDRFVSHLTKLVSIKEQASDAAALDSVIAAIKVVAFNQMQKRAELAPLIAELDAYRGKMNQKTYTSYADQVIQIKKRLTDLDVRAQAQQLTSVDAAAFFKDLESLINVRSQGLAADIPGIITWLQSVIPQSRLFFVTQGAKEKGSALLLVLQKPVTYLEHYNFLVGLLRDYSTFSSPQMTVDFLAKCDYLVSDDGKKQAQSEGFDYKKLAEILTFAAQNQLLASKDKIDVLLEKLNASLDSNQVITKTFNDILTAQETAITTLADAGNNLTTFVKVLEDLAASRLDGNDAELSRFSLLLQKAQWNGVIRKSAQSDTLLKKIQTCLNALAKPVLFADEAAYLTSLSKQPLTIPDQQDRFIAHVAHLVSIKDQATDSGALDQVLTAIKVVAYNQLQKRVELPPLVAQLDGYRSQMGQETVLSFAQKITDLTNRSNNLTAGAVDKFLADLSDVVKGRFEAGVDQLQVLSSLVNTVAWLNIVRTDKVKGYPKAVDALTKEVARTPSFAERLQDLSGMLSGDAVLNEVLQDSFVQRAQQLLAVKSNATNSQLITVIQTLKVAIFNQIKDRAQELQDILNTFIRQQQTIQLTGGLSFADRVKGLQQRLPSLTQQGLADFRQQVSDLFDARVDGSDDDIAQFKTLLQAAVWNNVVVALKSSGSSSASDDFTNWYNTVDAPIDFSVWKTSLAQMLQADTLPTVLQQQFMFKVGKLIAAISRANAQDLQDAQAMLIQASYNQLSSRKAELDLAIGKLKDAVSSQAVGVQLSFKERIAALKAKLLTLSKASVQTDIDAFVKMVSDLVDQRVDAINDDIKVLQTWLLSTEVQNNEALYFHQGTDQLTRLAASALNPVSYGLRVQNLMTLVQNNTVFTDAQKVFVQAKIQILTDLRAQAANENFALADVVKIIQFILDRRLDKNADGLMISKLNSAIYVLQSGTSGSLRPRYGDQIDAVKASLASLVAGDIPKFVAAVKALVDGRADGTQEQVNSLRDWLTGTDVQANKVLFFAPQKAELAKMAVTLQSLPAYLDRYNNLRQLLQDYPVFDSAAITKEFMDKSLVLVSERGRAAAEKLDLQYVKDLFVFAIQNRLVNDSASTNTLRQYMDALIRPPDEAVATGSSQSFSQRIQDLQAQFKAATQTNFSEFVTALSQLADSRIDGTDAEINTLKTWLNSNEVQNSRLVFLQGGLAQIRPLIDKLDVAITFAQRADNLRVMIQNTPTFTSTDQMLFFAKVDKLVADRWRAAQENYNIDDVVKLLQFVQVNQFSDPATRSQSDLITTKITAIKTAPDQQGPPVVYVTYPDRIIAIQNQFIQIGSLQKDLVAIKQLIQDINQLVVDRVDGADADRANLITFIRQRVLYHQLIYGVTSLEAALKASIDGLLAPITYGELYANFKKLLTVSVYSDDHKKLFISKLQALVVGRGDAVKAGVDLTQLVRDITFAKINKFSKEVLDDQRQTAPDRNPFIKQIEELSTQLLVAPLATLTTAIAKVQAEITNLSAENWAAAGIDVKRSLLARLRVLANNVDANSLASDCAAIDVLLATAKAIVFKGDDASRAVLEKYRGVVAARGGSVGSVSIQTSSAGVSAP